MAIRLRLRMLPVVLLCAVLLNVLGAGGVSAARGTGGGAVTYGSAAQSTPAQTGTSASATASPSTPPATAPVSATAALSASTPGATVAPSASVSSASATAPTLSATATATAAVTAQTIATIPTSASATPARATVSVSPTASVTATASATAPTLPSTVTPGRPINLTMDPTSTETGSRARRPRTPTAGVFASSSVSSACPADWSCADIGSPALAGDQSLSNGTWSVTGAGSDIWDPADQFHYVWQNVAGNSSMSARVTSQTNTGTCAKAGIMYRASTDPAAPNYIVELTPNCGGANEVYVQYRAAQGGSSTWPVRIAGTLPLYLKVTRVGNTFTAFISNDGRAWAAIAGSTVTISMPATALAGLAVDSYNIGATSTATFDTVSVGNLTWNAGVTALPQGLRSPAAAVGADGNVYLFGGQNDGTGADENTTYIYHPGSNAWSQGAAMPTALQGAQAVTLPDGRIVVLGGGAGCYFTQNCTIYSTVNAYDPRTDRWTAIPSMQSPRYRFAAVLANGQIYAIGGWNGSAALNSVEAYNPSTNSWSYVSGLPQATEAPTAAVDASGAIYVAGGYDGGSTFYNTLYVYNGGSWSPGPAMPMAREDTSAARGPDGRIYVVGGIAQATGLCRRSRRIARAVRAGQASPPSRARFAAPLW